MDIYTRLEQDHEQQRRLLDALCKTEGESTDRRNLWDETKVELEAHASAEEQTLYAALMAHANGSDKARHSVAEHQEASHLIAELDEIDMSSPAWLQKLKHLKGRIEHHVDEEEREIFPVAKKLITGDAAKSLAMDFERRKPAEKRKSS